MTPFVAAALQLAPAAGPLTPDSIKANIAAGLDVAHRCVDATGAALVVAPETLTTGWRRRRCSACGTWWGRSGAAQRPRHSPPSWGVLLDVADLRGRHRPGRRLQRRRGDRSRWGGAWHLPQDTHLFPSERQWATAGDDVLVVPTPLARLGSIICFDGDFPELMRIEAGMGAQIVVRPSGLQGADIWGLTTRKRRGPTTTTSTSWPPTRSGSTPAVRLLRQLPDRGADRRGLARGTSQPGWVSATIGLDPMATISPGSSVRQGFDRLAERNLALYRRHRDVLEAEETLRIPVAGEGMTASRLRLGIDTGGTFTDVVVLDEAGAITTTKTPSTPADHSAAFLAGAEKGLAAAGGLAGGVGVPRHDGGRNALLQGEVAGLGFLTTAEFRHLLEIGRQSVPDGYGNSYFWVKPDRIVPLHLVREVPERLDANGEVLRLVRRPSWPRHDGSRLRRRCGRRLPVARLRQPGPRAAGGRPVRRRVPRVRGLDQLGRAA